jgi:hypothetical protein
VRKIDPTLRFAPVLVGWVAPMTSTSVSARPISPATERYCSPWLSSTTSRAHGQA